jgi:putative Mn2+ efflux pump MntP
MSGNLKKPIAAGLGAIPRWIILGIGSALWLAAWFSKLPKWMATVVAVVVGLVWIVDDYIRKSAGLSEVKRRERSRNLAIALALGGLVALFYAATMIRLGPHALNRPM